MAARGAGGPSSGGEDVAGDVLLRLRTGTATEHQQLEDSLALLDPDLTAGRLVAVLRRMHAFWVAAESGLDAWAAAEPADAEAVGWADRRRADLFAADLQTLAAVPTGERAPVALPRTTDEALGAMYVLEGSTLGGVFIDRHLDTVPALAGVGTLRAFTPYGERTGAMWARFRRVTRDHVTRGGDPDAVVAAAGRTFRALAVWCADVEEPAPSPAGPSTTPGGTSA